MTRLPPDAFLPSGAMDNEMQLSLAGLASSQASSSIVSPLSLPGGVHYFETPKRPSVTSHPDNNSNLFSHANGPRSRDPPRAQPASFLSPHLTPIPSHAQWQLQFQRHPQQRASSLSPTRRPSGRRRDGAMDAKLDTDGGLLQTVASPKPSVPVDTISGTGSGLITVRRPAVRATEPTPANSQSSVQQQEHRRLERIRQAFDDERRYLQASRDRAEEVYKEIIEELEEDQARQRAEWEAEKYELRTQVMQLQNRLKEAESRGGSPVSDAKLATFQPGPSSQICPTGQPGGGPPPLISREKNSSESSATMDFDLGLPSKVIDVQEYHKDLEGIHLKENFVKKETFTDTPSSSGSSGKVSPPQQADGAKSLARARSMKALKADANSRLTMHAGHTPTVSLSIAHTGTSNTVVSSGSNTPTLMSGDGDGDGAMSDDNKDESSEPAEPVPTCIDDELHPAIMEPSDEGDHELKGPLTLRNMPAKDELFLRRLSDKLEKVTSGEDATPTVLKHSEDERGFETEIKAQVIGGDSPATDVDDAEEDVPLKLRKTSSNFGKPFGVA